MQYIKEKNKLNLAKRMSKYLIHILAEKVFVIH